MTVFSHKNLHGHIVREVFRDGAWVMERETADGVVTVLPLYAVSDLTAEKNDAFWCGYTYDEVQNSGRDLLGEFVLKQGEPTYATVASVLPPITATVEDEPYTFLSGFSSWSGAMVDRFGNIRAQYSGALKPPTNPVFSPTELDETLGNCVPYQCLLGGELPLLCSVHTDGERVMELFMFVEAADCHRAPVVWIRKKTYALSDPQHFDITYRIDSISRVIPKHEIADDTFLDALSETVHFWLSFKDKGAQFRLPESKLEHVVNGTQMFCATTFSGDHAHYGHHYYGQEIHDNFPPNYLWTLEMCCLFGRTDWARGMWRHLTEYVLTSEGRFCYRQGDDELYGASATEYGQLLYLLCRYKDVFDYAHWDTAVWEKVVGMGKLLLGHCEERDVFPGKTLVYMCAEADTNTRVHAYVNNNLWSIRGLNALAELLGGNEDARIFADMAKTLQDSVNILLADLSVCDERFGKLPPFRFDYTPTPANLSDCLDTFSPMSEEEWTQYRRPIGAREQSRAQDVLENTYANYRYYPEMLSAMLLDQESADAVVKLRETLGGECLGMTRFRKNLDDWPVLHYARYLIENGHIDKYLLLLYAHTCHHGHPDLMCYYEQVDANGKIYAPDCVPSLLTTPIMAAWAFAYEPVNNDALYLLSALPKAWFYEGASAEGIGLTDGEVSVSVDKSGVTFAFNNPITKPTAVVWRPADALTMSNVTSGAELVERIEGNRVYLKAGIAAGRIEFAV